MNKGFTFIEILIVLTVLSIMLIFSIFILRSYSEYMEKRNFIEQLQADLYYLHAYALNNKEAVTVRFSPTGRQYEALSGRPEETIIKKSIPEAIQIVESNIPVFTITPQGTVSNFGKIVFQHHDTRFSLVFYIGRGRFQIEE